MAILADPRHERFAQFMAEKRLSNAEAYRQAAGKPGMTTEAASMMANKWIKHDKISSRISELTALASGRCTYSRERYIQRLTEMFEARPDQARMDSNLCDVLVTRGVKHAVLPMKMAVAAQLSKVLGFDHPTEVRVEAGSDLATFLGGLFQGGTLGKNVDAGNGERHSPTQTKRPASQRV
jgi:hypothetical protein